MSGKVSDGKTIDVVAPVGGVVAGGFYRIDGWNGVAEVAADATEGFALNIDPVAIFRTAIPAGVACAKGAILYMPAAGGSNSNLTATATGNVAALKATAAKDATTNYADVRILNSTPASA